MKISDYIISVIFSIIRNETLPNITPVKLKFFDGNTDITNLLFGFNSYSLLATNFTSPFNKSIQNNIDLTVGTLLTSFSGDLTLKFYTSTDIELFTYTYAATIISGSSYILLANALRITLPNLNTNLANLLLNYIFKNITTDRPTTWFLELLDSNNTIYQTRIPLDITRWSKTYTNELGDSCIAYGKYTYIDTLTNNGIKTCKLYSALTGGTSWLDVDLLVPLNLYSGRILEIFNNSLVISISPSSLDINFLLESNPDNIFYVDGDGTMDNLATNTPPVSTNVGFNSSIKLFNSESITMSSTDTAEYAFNLPNPFTLELFVLFTTTPVGREITFIEKSGSIRIYQNILNNICVENNTGNLISVPWAVTTNVWYHIYLNKNTITNKLILRVNNIVNAEVSSISGTLFPVNSNTLRLNSSTKPILGLCNGLYISSSNISYNSMVKPLSKNPYIWKYITKRVWKNCTLQQWMQYCR
jgi:hypothetical protein